MNGLLVVISFVLAVAGVVFLALRAIDHSSWWWIPTVIWWFGTAIFITWLVYR